MKVVITIEDADAGVSLHCDWGDGGYRPESHAHAASLQVIRVMDEQCERKTAQVITTAQDVEQRLLAAVTDGA